MTKPVEFLEITTAIGCPVNCLKYCPQEKMGNLLTGTWRDLKDLHRTGTCRGCDLALFTPFYYARGLIQRHIFKGR